MFGIGSRTLFPPRNSSRGPVCTRCTRATATHAHVFLRRSEVRTVYSANVARAHLQMTAVVCKFNRNPVVRSCFSDSLACAFTPISYGKTVGIISRPLFLPVSGRIRHQFRDLQTRSRNSASFFPSWNNICSISREKEREKLHFGRINRKVGGGNRDKE